MNTAYQIYTDAAIERSSRMQGDMIAAAERDYRTDAEKRYPCPTTVEVLTGWNFAPNEFHCQTTITGRQTQLSMKITDPNNSTSVFYVTYDFEAEPADRWQCYCPSFRHHMGQTMIYAVMDRVTGGPFSSLKNEVN